MAVGDAVVTGGILEYLGIAGGFAVGTDFEERDPEQGIEPVQRHQHAHECIEREITAFEMHEFVLEDEPCLGRRELAVELCRQQQGRAQEAGDGRAVDTGSDQDPRDVAQAHLTGDLGESGEKFVTRGMASSFKAAQGKHEGDAAEHACGDAGPGDEEDVLPVDGLGRGGRWLENDGGGLNYR